MLDVQYSVAVDRIRHWDAGASLPARSRDCPRGAVRQSLTASGESGHWEAAGMLSPVSDECARAA